MMQVRRIYRNWESKDCHIQIHKFYCRRIMHFFSPNVHNELELIYTLRGNYELYRPDGTYRITGEAIYVVPPNEIHSIRSLCEDGEYMSVFVDPSAITMGKGHFLQKEFTKPLQEGILRFPRALLGDKPEYADAIGHMRQIWNLKQDDPKYREKLFLNVMGICVELIPFCKVLKKRNEDYQIDHLESDMVKKCVMYMHDHYAEKLSLSALAEHVHVHPNYLCAAFKKDVGMTVMEYLNRIRVEQARDLLPKRELSIAQVAEQCGFQSISTFQRIFKFHTGITPSGFAAKARR